MINASNIPGFDLDRVAAGDPLATRDALAYLRALLNAQQQQKTSRAWRDVAFDAADYTSLDAVNVGAGAWTVIAGNLLTYEIRKSGADTIDVQFFLSATSTSGAGAKVKLAIRLPFGYKVYPGQQYVGMGIANDPATATWLAMAVFADGTVAALQNQLTLWLLPIQTNWSNGSVTATSVRGFIRLRIANPAGS